MQVYSLIRAEINGYFAVLHAALTPPHPSFIAPITGLPVKTSFLPLSDQAALVLPAFKVDDHSRFVMKSLQAQGHPTLRYLIQWAAIALGNLKAWHFSPQQTAGQTAKELG